MRAELCSLRIIGTSQAREAPAYALIFTARFFGLNESIFSYFNFLRLYRQGGFGPFVVRFGLRCLGSEILRIARETADTDIRPPCCYRDGCWRTSLIATLRKVVKR